MRVQVKGFRNLLTNLTVRYVAAMTIIALLVCSNPFLVRGLLEKQEDYRKFIIIAAELSSLGQSVSQAAISFELHHSHKNLSREVTLIQGHVDRLIPFFDEVKKEALRLDLPLAFQGPFNRSLNEVDLQIQSLLEQISRITSPDIPTSDHSAMFIGNLIETQKEIYQSVHRCIQTLESALSNQSTQLRQIEWISTLIILSVLILQGVSILKPAIHKVRRTLLELEASEKKLLEAKEEAIEALKVKSDFVTKISHEIRNPLNAILGMGDLLLDTPLDSSQKRYVEILRRSGQAILDLINDFLDFSRMEAGRLELEHISYELADLVERSMDIVSSRAEDKGLELNLDFDWHLPKEIMGDPKRIQQILVNLLSNAVKFTSSGEVKLQVKKEIGPDSSNTLLLVVSDSGIGIPLNRQQTIFDGFVQVDSSINRKFGGNGLGLTICRDLTKMMNGTIQLQSEFEKGSTFEVRLPLQASNPISFYQKYQKLQLNRVPVGMMGRINASSRVIENILTSLGVNIHFFEVDTFSPIGGSLYFVDLDFTPAAASLVKQITRSAHVIWLCHLRELYQISSQFSGNPRFACIPKPIKLNQLYDVLKDLDKRPFFDSGIKNAQTGAESENQIAAKILIVEDSDDNRAVFRSYLKNSPHQVVFAINGREGFEKFLQEHFDLVFMDIQMPEMDGFETTRAIRKYELQRQRKAVPIIALTAYGHKEEIQKCMNSGCSRHLTKPIRKLTLLKVIQETLETHLQPSHLKIET
jgi:signal transduction histidine kinase/AmiR/NasT family two-component response regulator